MRNFPVGSYGEVLSKGHLCLDGKAMSSVGANTQACAAPKKECKKSIPRRNTCALDGKVMSSVGVNALACAVPKKECKKSILQKDACALGGKVKSSAYINALACAGPKKECKNSIPLQDVSAPHSCIARGCDCSTKWSRRVHPSGKCSHQHTRTPRLVYAMQTDSTPVADLAPTEQEAIARAEAEAIRFW